MNEYIESEDWRLSFSSECVEDRPTSSEIEVFSRRPIPLFAGIEPLINPTNASLPRNAIK